MVNTKNIPARLKGRIKIAHVKIIIGQRHARKHLVHGQRPAAGFIVELINHTAVPLPNLATLVAM